MTQNNDGDKKWNTSQMKKWIIVGSTAIVGLALALVIGVALAPQYLTQPVESKSVETKIEQQHETTEGDYYFHMCGDEKDPRKVPGTPENPAKLSRTTGEKITIPFCVSADNKTSEALLIGLESYREGPVASTTMKDASLQGKIADGIIASIDKPSLSIQASERVGDSAWSPSKNNGSADNFSVVLSANPDAELGKQMFGVSMFEPDETGVSGAVIIQWVYIDIVE